MTFSCINNTDVDRFFEAIAYKQAGYTIARIAFVALRVDNVFCILNGGLFMDTGTPRESFRFQSGDVLGGAYQLSELRLDPRQFVEALLKGEISTPEGKLQFRPNEGKTFLASYDPYKPGGSAQTRFDSLTILGGSVEVSQRTQAIDWELKAAPTPYNELHELIAELGLKPVSEKVSFEIVAFHVALVDGISTVTGTEARVALRLARGLEQAKAAIGYRVIVQGKVIERRSILGGAMQWRETQEFNKVSHR